MESSVSDSVEAIVPVERRRRRPAVSCSLCRQRKIKCNKEVPCSNCIRSKNAACIYETQQVAVRRQQKRHLIPSQPPTENKGRSGFLPPHSGFCSSVSQLQASTSPPTTEPAWCSASTSTQPTSVDSPASQAANDTLEYLRKRVRHLEDQLAEWPSTSRLEDRSADSERLKPIKTRLTEDVYPTDGGIMSKTRLFGRSHWMNSVMTLKPMIDDFMSLNNDKTVKTLALLQKCKSLGRSIKGHRNTKSAPQPGRLDNLPPRALVDNLVDCYFRTTESVFRVLHVPTFRKSYADFWSSQSCAPKVFILQLKLVMAIGATMHDDMFSLQDSAYDWIQEVDVWLASLASKTKFTIPCLQIMILSSMAHLLAGPGGDLTWVSIGSLIRTAIYMGLHRDPSRLPRMNPYSSELRRRLWNTILELALQTSIDSGGPPMISLADFDVKVPGNFDDTQLVETAGVISPAQTPESFTETSVAIALRQTFPIRLAIVKSLNDLRTRGKYAETLRLDQELRSSYKRLSASLLTLANNSSRARGELAGPSVFAIRFVDFLNRQYFQLLHLPFASSINEATYAFSRRVLIDTSFRLARAAIPSSTSPTPLVSSNITSTPSTPSTLASSSDIPTDLANLFLSGASFLRSVPSHSCFYVASDLRAQLIEEQSLSPLLDVSTGAGAGTGTTFSSSLPGIAADNHPFAGPIFSLVRDACDWTLRRIRAGETNIKGHVLMCAIAAQLEGLARGRPDDEVRGGFLRAAEESVENCLGILEERAAQYQNAAAAAEAGREGLGDRGPGGAGPDAGPGPQDTGEEEGWGMFENLSDVELEMDELGPFFNSVWPLNGTSPDLPNWQ